MHGNGLNATVKYCLILPGMAILSLVSCRGDCKVLPVPVGLAVLVSSGARMLPQWHGQQQHVEHQGQLQQ